jgi:hypothetical protein
MKKEDLTMVGLIIVSGLLILNIGLSVSLLRDVNTLHRENQELKTKVEKFEQMDDFEAGKDSDKKIEDLERKVEELLDLTRNLPGNVN